MDADDKFKNMLSKLCTAVYDQQYVLNSRGWVTEEDGRLADGWLVAETQPLEYSQQWSHAGARKHLYEKVDELLCEASWLIEDNAPGTGQIWVGSVRVTEFSAPSVISDSKGRQFPTAIHFASDLSMDLALDMCAKTYTKLRFMYNNSRESYVFHDARIAVLPDSPHDRVRMVMIYSTFTIESNDE